MRGKCRTSEKIHIKSRNTKSTQTVIGVQWKQCKTSSLSKEDVEKISQPLIVLI